MNELSYLFPVSGVETQVWLPPLVAFVISLFTSMVGISGAVLLLPFQMTVLGYTTPSVSGTNLVYNLFAIPSGVYRYWKEGRMAWPLAWVIILGTLPGTFIGWWLHVRYLPETGPFMVFAGLVLLLIAVQVLLSLRHKTEDEARSSSAIPVNSSIINRAVNLRRVELEFQGESISFSTPGMFLLALVIGVIGGAYGIGGGAIIAPFCISFFRLPVYIVAGAALVGTLVTSAFGIALYSFMPVPDGMMTRPDWLLGLLFGVGGFAGIYAGAKMQRFVPERVLKIGLGVLLISMAAKYLLG
ncbi:MAG TPA: hypothetical protein DDW55_09590 [Gammaproteobacteria bacterium]|nr:hypothetical protein [Gammaproteobacteria bacterium]